MPEHREAVISLLVRAPLPAAPAVSPRPVAEQSREVNPSSERAVAAGLLAYLKPRLAPAVLEYAEPPVHIPNGWETYTYRLQLRDTPWLAPAFRRPLILHIYASPRGVPRGRHEFAVQRHLHQLGYPVPEPIVLEESCELFGGPFLLFEQAPGRTLFETLLYQPWRFCRGPAKMAAAHARLHALPIDRFPAPAGPFLPRRLEEMRQLIREYGLNGLQPGWTWLAEHGPEAPRSPSILHLDYHPVNIVCRGLRSLAVSISPS